ncbi:MAG: hypothetical protein FWF63_04950 [Fibromonadales bacterium]|nr:hypothetical protein [Fibromonadales bacterium]
MPTTTQNPATSTSGTSVPSSTHKEQLATCEKVRTFDTKNGKKSVGVFALNDGQPVFDVWESDYFKPELNAVYRPVVVVLPSAYKNKEGEARANMKPFTNWEKVGG